MRLRGNTAAHVYIPTYILVPYRYTNLLGSMLFKTYDIMANLLNNL